MGRCLRSRRDVATEKEKEGERERERDKANCIGKPREYILGNRLGPTKYL